jgi:hypothetical protein
VKWLILAVDPAAITEPVCDECGRAPGAREKIDRRADAVWTQPAVLCPGCRAVVHDRAGAKVSAMVDAWREARAATR